MFRKYALGLADHCFPPIVFKMAATNDVSDGQDASDMFKILVATDCHLGYVEKDPIRGMDSFIAFEEILSLAGEHDVDFILLGGDLFHENKPSRYCLYRCIELLRKYTLGDRPVQFEVLNKSQVNDVSINGRRTDATADDQMTVNYEDPNLNVSFPVFSIHGNHDDPAGQGQLSSMDLLAATGLVNHFGKCLNMEQVIVTPLLMQKGNTRLALYGLGSIRDERLHRIFRENRVTMLRPKEDTDRWFNVFVVHQNRSKHSATSFLPESFLDDFLDLIIWGHEHECRITPEKNHSKNFFVSQPGSSVATSLASGEAAKKHVGILHVNGLNFKMEEIPLKTVRPFVFEDVVLSETSLDRKTVNVGVKTKEYCDAVVEELIKRSVSQISGDERQPKLPLIRLRVEYEQEEETFSIHRFGQKYLNRVANPKDIILFHRKRTEIHRADKDAKGQGFTSNEADLVRFDAVDLVKKYFETAEKKHQLEMLTETGLGKAVKDFVDKLETEAIKDLVQHQVSKTQKHLDGQQIDSDNIQEKIDDFRKERRARTAEEDSEVNEALRVAKQNRIASGIPDEDENRDDVYGGDTDEDAEFGEPLAPAPTRGSRGGRGRARGSRSSSRGRGRASERVDEAETSKRKATPKRASTRGRQSRAAVNTIERAFASSRASTRSGRSSRSYAEDQEEEEEEDEDNPLVISESDEEEQPKTKKRRADFQSTSRYSSSQRMGLVFEDDF